MEMDTLLEEYKGLEEEKQRQQELRHKDADILVLKQRLGALEQQEAELQKFLRANEEIYLQRIAFANDRQSEIKSEIASRWNVLSKTYKSNIATVTLRVTKSLIVGSKAKIIDVLARNNKLVEGISKFDLRLLRKFKEVGLLPDDAARFEESKNVTINLVGGEE